MDYPESTEQVPTTPESETRLLQIVLDRAPAELARLAEAADDAAAFMHLPAAAAAAFHLGRFADAKSLAEQTLALAPAFRQNWNYGNAIHRAHTVLGLLALNAGDHSLAVDELHSSGDTPGSPQLSSFAPTMHLAKALLRVGQVEPVFTYLDQCRAFWKSGSDGLDLWERKICEGVIPNFFQHDRA